MLRSIRPKRALPLSKGLVCSAACLSSSARMPAGQGGAERSAGIHPKAVSPEHRSRKEGREFLAASSSVMIQVSLPRISRRSEVTVRGRKSALRPALRQISHVEVVSGIDPRPGDGPAAVEDGRRRTGDAGLRGDAKSPGVAAVDRQGWQSPEAIRSPDLVGSRSPQGREKPRDAWHLCRPTALGTGGVVPGLPVQGLTSWLATVAPRG